MRFVAVMPSTWRHVNIHQDQVERLAVRLRIRESFHGLRAITYHGRIVPEPDQQRARQQRVDVVVFRDEDRERVGRRAFDDRTRLCSDRCGSSRLLSKRAAKEAAPHRLDEIAGETCVLQRSRRSPRVCGVTITTQGIAADAQAARSSTRLRCRLHCRRCTVPQRRVDNSMRVSSTSVTRNVSRSPVVETSAHQFGFDPLRGNDKNADVVQLWRRRRGLGNRVRSRAAT